VKILATSPAELVPWSDGIQPLSAGSNMPTPTPFPSEPLLVGQFLLSPSSWS